MAQPDTSPPGYGPSTNSSGVSYSTREEEEEEEEDYLINNRFTEDKLDVLLLHCDASLEAGPQGLFRADVARSRAVLTSRQRLILSLLYEEILLLLPLCVS
jgi:hypothetical protein